MWKAITTDELFSIWYAPGSVWSIPNLQAGEFAEFTLKPSAHNDLKQGESVLMLFVIQEVVPFERFSFASEQDDLFFSYELSVQSNQTKVTLNMEGFDPSLDESQEPQFELWDDFVNGMRSEQITVNLHRPG